MLATPRNIPVLTEWVEKPSTPPYACYPAFKPRNRQERRALIHEMQRNFVHLNRVENMFYEALFSADYDPATYEQIFLSYQDMYQEVIRWMKITGKFKHSTPNPTYFHDRYKPLEKGEL